MNSYKIMVVDDDKKILKFLKDFLELENYTVITAENGEDVLKKINTLPDLILLDINMPHMSGLEVCKRIRDYVSCPIIFLTAYMEDEDKIIGLKSGGDDYIVKPFNIDELLARIEAHLRREQRNVGKRKCYFQMNYVLTIRERKLYTMTMNWILQELSLILLKFYQVILDRCLIKNFFMKKRGDMKRKVTATWLQR